MNPTYKKQAIALCWLKNRLRKAILILHHFEMRCMYKPCMYENIHGLTALRGIPSTKLNANPGLFRLASLLSARVAYHLPDLWESAK